MDTREGRFQKRLSAKRKSQTENVSSKKKKRLLPILSEENSVDQNDAEKKKKWTEKKLESIVSALGNSERQFLKNCNLAIGDERKAIIRENCANEGFLIDIDGCICALHVSQLFEQLEDFDKPMEWFSVGEEIVVYIRNVLSIEHTLFLRKTDNLTGNLIASATLLPPHKWILKITSPFTVYKSDGSSNIAGKLNICVGPTHYGFLPFPFWDEVLLRKGMKKITNGTALNVLTFQKERPLWKFTNFVSSRVSKEECKEPQKGTVIPIVRINGKKCLLSCKSRFVGWKVVLPLTEIGDTFDGIDFQTNLIPALALVMAVDVKQKVVVVSTRPSRLKAATKSSSLSMVLPKRTPVHDHGIMNLRLLNGRRNEELRGFIVKKWDEDVLKVFLGIDYVWPILASINNTTPEMCKTLNHLSVARVRLNDDEYEDRRTISVDIIQSNSNEDSDVEVEEVQHPDYTCTQDTGLEGDFDWDFEAQPNLSSLSQDIVQSEGQEKEDVDEEVHPKLKSKAEREAERRRKEMIMKKEEQQNITEHKEEPKTVQDFDRMVLANPGDSSLWLRYMAFHVEQLETDKARQIAGRALKILGSDEQEKLNIWFAVLNLESLHGSQESLEKSFREALKHNDTLKIYLHLAKIYAPLKKIESARETYTTILKKFKMYKEAWLSFGSWLFEIGEVQEARNVMKRSLLSIPEREHIGVIQKFAHLEFSNGEHGFGKSLMNNLLRSYPKRLDLWFVFIDQLVKIMDHDECRKNFQKLIEMKFPVKKMKSVFKKWLTFEQDHGSQESVEKVKQLVVDYIQEQNV